MEVSLFQKYSAFARQAWFNLFQVVVIALGEKSAPGEKFIPYIKALGKINSLTPGYFQANPIVEGVGFQYLPYLVQIYSL